MKISELRPIVKKYNKDELENIIVELYKRVPKNVKEDYNIDDYIINIQSATKNVVKKNDEVDFNELKDKIIRFIRAVDEGLYCRPNRAISKSERSKWRFKVKKYYKLLNLTDPATSDGEDATLLLIELFKRLSCGIVTLLFTNWNTFNAIGVYQVDYFINIYNRISSSKILDKYKIIYDLLFLPIDSYGESLDELYTNLVKDDDERNYMINLAKNKIDNLKEELKNKKLSYNAKYNIKELINQNVKLIVRLYIGLNEIEKAKKYFNDNFIYENIENKVYILLNILEEYNLIDEWITEYEKYPKIEYKKYLIEKYYKFKNDRG